MPASDHRHAGKDGFVTQIGDDRFAAFRTGPSKSREAFLAVLRAGHTDFVVNAEALDYMRGRSLAGPVIAQLAAHPTKNFVDDEASRRAPLREELAVLGRPQVLLGLAMTVFGFGGLFADFPMCSRS